MVSGLFFIVFVGVWDSAVGGYLICGWCSLSLVLSSRVWGGWLLVVVGLFGFVRLRRFWWEFIFGGFEICVVWFGVDCGYCGLLCLWFLRFDCCYGCLACGFVMLVVFCSGIDWFLVCVCGVLLLLWGWGFVLCGGGFTFISVCIGCWL